MHMSSPAALTVKNFDQSGVFKTYADAIKKGDQQAASNLVKWVSDLIVSDGTMKIEESLTIVSQALRNTFHAQQAQADGEQSVNMAQILEDAIKSSDTFQNLSNLSANPEKIFLGEQPIALKALSEATKSSASSATRKVTGDTKSYSEGQMLETLSKIYQEAQQELKDSGLRFKAYGADAEQNRVILEHNNNVQNSLVEAISRRIKSDAGSFSKEFLSTVSPRFESQASETTEIFGPLVRNDSKLKNLLIGSKEIQDALNPGELSNEQMQSIEARSSELSEKVAEHLKTISELADTSPGAIPTYISSRMSQEEKAYLNLKLKEANVVESAIKGQGSLLDILANQGLGKLLGSALFGYLFGFVFGMPVLAAGITTALSFLGSSSEKGEAGNFVELANRRKPPEDNRTRRPAQETIAT